MSNQNSSFVKTLIFLKNNFFDLNSDYRKILVNNRKSLELNGSKEIHELTGLSKYFNSQTIAGRANVSY